MGHGDEIVMADANFTAETLGRSKPIIRLPGIALLRTCEAVLSVLPLDAAVARPVAYMKVCQTPVGYTSALQQSVISLLLQTGHAFSEQCEAMERFSFYERVEARVCHRTNGRNATVRQLSF
jgi:L-fucose mutarotase